MRSVYVCVCLCVCVRVWASVHGSACPCECAHTFTCLYTWVHMATCVRLCACMVTCLCLCTCSHMQGACVHVHAGVHVLKIPSYCCHLNIKIISDCELRAPLLMLYTQYLSQTVKAQNAPYFHFLNFSFYFFLIRSD